MGPDAWVEIVGRTAGTAAGGVVRALLLAIILAPGLLASLSAVSLWKHGTLRKLAWRYVIAGMCAETLLCLAVEFASEELGFWYQRIALAVAFSVALLGVLALPMAAWRGRRRGRPLPTVGGPPLANVTRPSAPAVGLVITAVLLLVSLVPATLLKNRVVPEHWVWSASEAVGLAIVATPFTWLLGRVAFRRRRGSGFLALATTVALSGWLSLAGRWQLAGQAAAAMQELAAMMRTLLSDEKIVANRYGRWQYGPYTPMLQGMSRLYAKMYESVRSLDDLEAVLTPTAFRDTESTRGARARLDALRHRVGRIDSEIEEATGRLRAEIDQAKVPANMRRKMLEGINRGLSDSPARLTSSLTPMLQALEELVRFVESRPGRYEFEDGHLVFDTDADVARFNRLLDNVTAQQAMATAAAEKQMTGSKAGIDSFGEWAKDPFSRPPPRE